MADEFRLLESFGAIGDGAANDQPAISAALIWSADNGLPVYGFHDYRLGASLQIPTGATLIATPTARFLRGFGGDTNLDEGGFPLVATAACWAKATCTGRTPTRWRVRGRRRRSRGGRVAAIRG